MSTTRHVPRLTDDMGEEQIAQIGAMLAELQSLDGWRIFEQLLERTYNRIAVVGLQDETTDPWFYRGQLKAIEVIKSAVGQFVEAYRAAHKDKTEKRQAQRLVTGGGGDIAV